MTVSSQVSSVSYLGDGVTTLLPVPYYFLEQGHLLVTRVNVDTTTTTLVLGSDYSVSGAGNQAGGSITMFAAPAVGVQIIIERAVPATQETDYVANDPFPAESHERALDKLTMLVQQTIATLARALLRPIGKNYYDAEGRLIKNLGDGVSDQDAVNVRTMRNYVDMAVAGVVGGFGWFLQAGIGAVNRTFQSKMRDVVSVTDFTGADPTGTTDSTGAFLLAGPGSYVPEGFYLVDTLQVNVHTYHGPGVILSKGKRIPLTSPLLDGPIGMKVGGVPAFGFTASGPDARIYTGSENATQGITWISHEGVEKIFITQRVSGSSWATDELVRISEWRWAGDGSGMTVVTFTDPLSIGHGSDLTALVENGEIYLYTTARNDGAEGGGASLGGKGISKIRWNGAATSMSDVQLFEVFGDPGDGSRLYWPQRASVCASNDGRYLIFIATSNVGTGRFFFLYDRAEVEAAGQDARGVRPLIGPVPFERAPGEFGATLQGMASDGVHLYTVWGFSAPRSIRTIQVYDMNGQLRRSIPYAGAAAIYSESDLNGLGPKGLPTTFEPEGVCLRGDELLTLSIDSWRAPQDIVSYEGFNWASLNTVAAAGIPPTTRSNWVITKLAPTMGAYNPATAYIAGAYIRRDKRIMTVKLATGEVGELNVQGAATDPSTGTIKSYYNGTDIAFNAENESFTIAKFFEALGTYRVFAEFNFENTFNLFSTRTGDINNRWVSIKSAWNSAMYGMQLRSSGGNAADGANADFHAIDCPAAPGECVLSSTSTSTVRLRNGSTTIFTFNSTGAAYFGSVTLRSTSDGVVQLGRSINRWSEVFASTGVINTSDATEKTPISQFSEAHIKIGLRLTDELGMYQWLNEIENKGGDVARIHIGTTVQRAIEIFEEEGVDPFRFGAICLDEWEAHTEVIEPAELDENGAVIREEILQTIPAGRRFGFRDHQLQYLLLASIAWRQREIMSRLDMLEGK